MNYKKIIYIGLAIIFMNFKSPIKKQKFNIKKDLLLVQFDCKTDVDDIHTIAAMATLITHKKNSKINYHAVTGTYGVQKGLYVPPNDLLQLSFGNNWTDAHKNFDNAIKKVKKIVLKTLKNNGDIWIAEAGQSDFSSALIKSIQHDLPNLNVNKHIHIVQHSNWNEKSTSKESLQFVKENSDYVKIPDGNDVGNGSPGFRDATYTSWQDKIINPKLTNIWQLAINIANKYNGKNGRYNNKAVAAGGLDFSDLSEVCCILGIKNIKDTSAFFNAYAH